MANTIDAHAHRKMSRAQRTARGMVFTAAATLFAAASHVLAGGNATLFAIIATTIVSLPLGVALAGREGSLWRQSLGVVCSQLLYHWSFAGLGVMTTSIATQPHVHDSSFNIAAFTLAANETTSWGMWFAHACAALVTITLLWCGDRALGGLRSLLKTFFGIQLPAVTLTAAETATRLFFGYSSPPLTPVRFLSALSQRGPPLHLLAPG